MIHFFFGIKKGHKLRWSCGVDFFNRFTTTMILSKKYHPRVYNRIDASLFLQKKNIFWFICYLLVHFDRKRSTFISARLIFFSSPLNPDQSICPLSDYGIQYVELFVHLMFENGHAIETHMYWSASKWLTKKFVLIYLLKVDV